jgi:hypothetical protein
MTYMEDRALDLPRSQSSRRSQQLFRARCSFSFISGRSSASQSVETPYHLRHKLHRETCFLAYHSTRYNRELGTEMLSPSEYSTHATLDPRSCCPKLSHRLESKDTQAWPGAQR